MERAPNSNLRFKPPCRPLWIRPIVWADYREVRVHKEKAPNSSLFWECVYYTNWIEGKQTQTWHWKGRRGERHWHERGKYLLNILLDSRVQQNFSSRALDLKSGKNSHGALITADHNRRFQKYRERLSQPKCRTCIAILGLFYMPVCYNLMIIQGRSSSSVDNEKKCQSCRQCFSFFS